MAGGPKAVDVSADAAEFVSLAGRMSTLSKEIKTAMRKELRAAATRGAKEVKSTVKQPPLRQGRRPRSRGLRASIASGVKVQIAAGAAGSRVGVFIRSTGSGLSGDRKKLVKRWDSTKPFRHPVFGRGGWANQWGRPYFKTVLNDQRDQIETDIRAAIEKAKESL